ncbi:MAG: hypothetical protein K6A65_06005 [Succinivibrionaceae bacterium]|nr:hypothetical protein [Succinivibrionaceae bacterium]
MSIYAATKGTALEEAITAAEQGEANGAVIYQALALLAREGGFAEEAETFTEIAHMEAMHAAFYAVMNGKYQRDFWQMAKDICALEEKADAKMAATIERVRALGTDEAQRAAEGMELIKAQEAYHAKIMGMLIARHEGRPMEGSAAPAPEPAAAPAGEKVYVCKVCGYEYVGNLDDEPDDYVCPICHKGKEAFAEKA